MNTQMTRTLHVVHSSLGRVRVHLPDPEGHIAARVRRLPGVTFAEGSQWTQNMLVLFEPAATNEEAVLGELVRAAQEGHLPSAAPEPPLIIAEICSSTALQTTSREPHYATGWRRTIYLALGWLSVVLAAIGLAVPGIPGAPFVVLAGFFFIRSSPSAHAWLRNSRWFGPLLRDWEEQHGVRRSLKYTAMLLIAIAILVILLSGLPLALVAFILLCEIIGMVIVVNLKEVEPTPPLVA